MWWFTVFITVLLFGASCIGEIIPEDSWIANVILILLIIISMGSVIGARR